MVEEGEPGEHRGLFRQRRRRVEGGREFRVNVRFTEEEYAAVAARAVAARVSMPAMVAAAALAPVETQGGAVLPPDRVRALIIELYAIRRGMTNAGRNINDVNRFALGTGELKEDTEAAVADFRGALAKLEAFLEQAQHLMPGVDLSRAGDGGGGR